MKKVVRNGSNGNWIRSTFPRFYLLSVICVLFFSASKQLIWWNGLYPLGFEALWKKKPTLLAQQFQNKSKSISERKTATFQEIFWNRSLKPNKFLPHIGITYLCVQFQINIFIFVDNIEKEWIMNASRAVDDVTILFVFQIPYSCHRCTGFSS